eukprot:2687740-Alexandrium_andersonii.AAC.1
MATTMGTRYKGPKTNPGSPWHSAGGGRESPNSPSSPNMEMQTKSTGNMISTPFAFMPPPMIMMSTSSR